MLRIGPSRFRHVVEIQALITSSTHPLKGSTLKQNLITKLVKTHRLNSLVSPFALSVPDVRLTGSRVPLSQTVIQSSTELHTLKQVLRITVHPQTLLMQQVGRTISQSPPPLRIPLP